MTLTVTDDDGATDTATTTATVRSRQTSHRLPIPTVRTLARSVFPVNFDGTGSSDPDGTIVAYDWDFGDGGTGTGVTPTHTYAAAGIYTVTLTVTDDGGVDRHGDHHSGHQRCAASSAPVADANGPYTGTAGVALTFDGSGSY